jgi:hypothetical protein
MTSLSLAQMTGLSLLPGDIHNGYVAFASILLTMVVAHGGAISTGREYS